jgi:hypothetical protein
MGGQEGRREEGYARSQEQENQGKERKKKKVKVGQV